MSEDGSVLYSVLLSSVIGVGSEPVVANTADLH